MKKFALIIAVLTTVLFTKASYAAEIQDSIISSKGTAKMSVKPDVANISISVITENKKLIDAFNENNIKAKNIYQSLKTLLGKENNEIKTTNFSVSPVYYWDKLTSKNILKGYRVQNQIKLKTTQTEKLGTLIQTAVENDANNVSDIAYSISNDDQYCLKLLEQASLNAKKEAEVIAKALGVTITGIKRVSTNCNKPIFKPFYGRALDGIAESAIMAPPIETGETELNAEVFVDFLIESPQKLNLK